GSSPKLSTERLKASLISSESSWLVSLPRSSNEWMTSVCSQAEPVVTGATAGAALTAVADPDFVPAVRSVATAALPFVAALVFEADVGAALLLPDFSVLAFGVAVFAAGFVATFALAVVTEVLAAPFVTDFAAGFEAESLGFL